MNYNSSQLEAQGRDPGREDRWACPGREDRWGYGQVAGHHPVTRRRSKGANQWGDDTVMASSETNFS